MEGRRGGGEIPVTLETMKSPHENLQKVIQDIWIVKRFFWIKTPKA
jgi:hypothetical protein